MSLLEKLSDQIAFEPNCGCWLWMGPLSPEGYASVGYKLMHRKMYEDQVGPIPPGLHLDHLCRVRSCINPAHLEPVTPAENILRGVGVMAKNARKTSCKYGHEFTPENTVVTVGYNGRTWRRCKQCQSTFNKRWRRKMRGKILPGAALAEALRQLLAASDPYRSARDTDVEIEARAQAVRALWDAGYTTSLQDAAADPVKQVQHD